MGYEVKLIVGVRTDQVNYKKPEQNWFHVYAEIDLSKIGTCPLEKLMFENQTKKPVVFWYGTDGNTTITEDRYGESYLPIPIKLVVKAVEKCVAGDDYRRFKWALALLKSMQGNTEDISVVAYGH